MVGVITRRLRVSQNALEQQSISHQPLPRDRQLVLHSQLLAVRMRVHPLQYQYNTSSVFSLVNSEVNSAWPSLRGSTRICNRLLSECVSITRISSVTGEWNLQHKKRIIKCTVWTSALYSAEMWIGALEHRRKLRRRPINRHAVLHVPRL